VSAKTQGFVFGVAVGFALCYAYNNAKRTDGV